MNLYPFTPYDARGLGYAYNTCCAAVPKAEDVVVLKDGDVMMLPGSWGSHVLDAITRHPQYEVFVCMATRTWCRGDQGAQQLRHPTGIREERDLAALFGVVDRLQRQRYAEVVPWPDKRAPSGFFMAFRRSVWDRHPFPLLGAQGLPRIGIETRWFRGLFKARVPVGLMVGLAAIHFYRLDRPNDRALGYLAQA